MFAFFEAVDFLLELGLLFWVRDEVRVVKLRGMILAARGRCWRSYAR